MVASSTALIERARSHVGLADLGPGPWLDGLERLLLAVEHDCGDDADAVVRIEDLVTARLVQRLRIEGWIAEHAVEQDHPVDGPIVVVGLPRSGTTAMHFLLAQDTQFRYLRTWEVNDPVPPPDPTTEHDDPRRPRTVADDVRHLTAVDGPAEDWPIHALVFDNAELTLPVPSFSRSWLGRDHDGVFAYHDRVLRLLHSRRPPYRWLLKMPSYLFMLGEMVAHYPDVRFVWTHRDPVAVLASTCSTVAFSRQRRTPTWEPDAAFGRRVLDHWGRGMQLALATRAELGDDRFVDVAQRDLDTDPVGVAERVYAGVGLTLDVSTAATMAAWAGANRRDSRGEHRYDLADYGLTPADVEGTFAPYLARFGTLV